MSIKAKYPTSQEIMEKPVKYKQNMVNTVNSWKLVDFINWKQKSNKDKLQALYRLLTGLSIVYNKPLCVIYGHEFHYQPANSTIMLDSQNPSIISTLHEFGHHILGPSETKACRWSVWLFKRIFPKSFAKLQFIPNSHMLCKVKRNRTISQNS